jgi:hypothetical protein
MDYLNFLDESMVPSQHYIWAHNATFMLAQKYSFEYSQEFSLLTAYVYPDHSAGSLALANHIHMFLWALDDLMDDPHTRTHDKLIILKMLKKLLRSGTVSNYNLVRCLEEILRMFEEDVRQYLITQFLDYFRGIKKHLLLHGKILSIQKYLDIRLKDGACEVVWPLMFLDKQDIRDCLNLLRSKKGRRARLLANLNIIIANDLASIHKDIRNGETFNIIFS